MCGTKQTASKAEALDSAGIQTGKKRRKAGEPMAKVKGTRGYKSYHGRSGGKKLLVVLLVLALAAASVFMLIQQYVVYDADGSFRFELPWHDRIDQTAAEGSSEDGSAQPELEIIVEEPITKDTYACELDAAVLQGGWEAALEGLDPDINAVAVRVKKNTGEILYDSHIAGAVDCGAVTGSSVARDSLQGLNDSGYYTIARISALHDSRYAYAHMTDAAVCQLTGYVWYDTYSTHWLAPEKELARQYVVDIARECAELGFDELLLDDFCYPRDGRMSRIKTDERTMTKQAALALLAGELQKALEDYDIKLSVSIDADIVLAGSEERTGIVVSELAPKFDRVYVAATEETLPQIAAAMEGIDTELVPMTSTAPVEGSYLITE